jgi:endonuclease/exonuclease/phosphatase family metal-dependent hydrolase
MNRVRALALVAAFAAGSSVGSVGTYFAVAPDSVDTPPTPAAMAGYYGDEDSLAVCSFNVQFLGNSRRRDDPALASILSGFDIVVIQELVGPPYAGKFPDGTSFKPDAEAREFFDCMLSLGFEYVLSEEDTGTGDVIHRNNSATEWWVAFYKPDRVQPAHDLPVGFLATDRSNHPDFERVPYAFAFRSSNDTADFVLISVHLMPGGSARSAARRQHELAAIAAWVDAHDGVEHDFIILGDMNIEDTEELHLALPTGFVSLNDECVPTNTNVNGPKPYDHVLIDPVATTEVDTEFDFQVVDLIEMMAPLWSSESEPYPGDPYDHNRFRQYFSDHHPVVFHITLPPADDD